MFELPLVCFSFGSDHADFTANCICLKSHVLTSTQSQGSNTVSETTKSKSKCSKGSNDRFHKLYDRTEIIVTEEAIKKEMAEVWATIRGPVGDRMREKIRGTRSLYKKSWRDGETRKVMEGLDQYF